MSKKTIISALGLLALTVLPGVSLLAQTGPNFSGTWKQNNEKSSLRSDAPVWIHKVAHNDPDLKVVTIITGGRGESAPRENSYTTDGKEQVTKDREGDEFTRSVKWDGNTLVFLTVEKEGANTITTREVWTMSEDGKTLTKTRHTSSYRGERDQRYVYDRQQ